MKKTQYTKLPIVLGEIILYYRREVKNLSLQQLAEKVNIDANNLSRIERGEQLPSIVTFIKLMSALDMNISESLPRLVEEIKEDEMNRG